MADPRRDLGAHESVDDDAGVPRWVKVLGIVVAVVALLVVTMLFLGRGGAGHTPRRHGGAADNAPPASAMQDTPLRVVKSGPPRP